MKRPFLQKSLFAFLLFFAFSFPLIGYAKYSDNSKQITKDNDPVGYDNVMAAVNFIRSMGDNEMADDIQKWLENGNIYWDSIKDASGITDFNWWDDDDITLDRSVIHPVTMKRRITDSPDAFDELVSLAGVLYHEKIHAHQNTLFRLTKALPGSDPPEIQAHEKEIYAYDDWAQKMFDDSKKISEQEKKIAILKKLLTLLQTKLTYLDDFINDDCFGDPGCDAFKKLRDTTKDWIEELKMLLDKLQQPENPKQVKNEEVRVGSLIKEDIKEEQTALASTLNLPNDTDEVSLTGQEKAAGKVFQLEVVNHTAATETVVIPEGLVLVPTTPRYQRMIIGEDFKISIPPHGSESAPLVGYCLDHDKLPPPGVKMSYGKNVPSRSNSKNLLWTIPFDQTPYKQFAAIVKTGNRISATGKYNTTIQDPKTYKTGVIERAIWLQSSGLGKDALSLDVERKMEQLPQKNRPTKKQMDNMVNTIWDDVNLTVKESQVPSEVGGTPAGSGNLRFKPGPTEKDPCEEILDELKQAEKDLEKKIRERDETDSYLKDGSDLLKREQEMLKRAQDDANKKHGQAQIKKNLLINAKTNGSDEEIAKAQKEYDEALEAEKKADAEVEKIKGWIAGTKKGIEKAKKTNRGALDEEIEALKRRIEELKRKRNEICKQKEEAKKPPVAPKEPEPPPQDDPYWTQPLPRPQKLDPKQILAGLGVVGALNPPRLSTTEYKDACEKKCADAILIFIQGGITQLVSEVGWGIMSEMAGRVELGGWLEKAKKAYDAYGKAKNLRDAIVGYFQGHDVEVIPISGSQDNCEINGIVVYTARTGVVDAIFRCTCCGATKILRIRYHAKEDGRPSDKPNIEFLK